MYTGISAAARISAAAAPPCLSVRCPPTANRQWPMSSACATLEPNKQASLLGGRAPIAASPRLQGGRAPGIELQRACHPLEAEHPRARVGLPAAEMALTASATAGAGMSGEAAAGSSARLPTCFRQPPCASSRGCSVPCSQACCGAELMPLCAVVRPSVPRSSWDSIRATTTCPPAGPFPLLLRLTMPPPPWVAKQALLARCCGCWSWARSRQARITPRPLSPA